MGMLSRPSDDFGKLILRWAVGGVVLLHGIYKLQHGVAWIETPLAGVGLPAFLAYGAYVGEVLAPLLLIVGWQVRLAALVVVFDMAMAILLVLRGQVLALKESGGGWAIELEMLILLGAVAIFFLGSGRYGVAARSKPKD